MRGRAFLVWLAILLLANLNGALRELVLLPLAGEGTARILSTVALCAIVLLVARATIRWIAPASSREALGVGVLWLVLTLAFEFLAGHYLFGTTWEQIVREYDVGAGRIWVLVPIVTLLSPRWAWGRVCRSRGARAGGLVVALGAALTSCSGPAEREVDGGARIAEVAAEAWAARLDGAGPVTYGMSLKEAGAAAGDSAVVRPMAEDCDFVVFGGMPEGMRFMVEHGRIVRADVTGSAPGTDRGAQVGMAVSAVQRLYGESLLVKPHKYDSAGQYLVLVPPGADSSRRLIFESDGRIVTRYRAGLRPAVEYVEGCG